jgi:hypothetical protein
VCVGEGLDFFVFLFGDWRLSAREKREERRAPGGGGGGRAERRGGAACALFFARSPPTHLGGRVLLEARVQDGVRHLNCCVGWGGGGGGGRVSPGRVVFSAPRRFLIVFGRRGRREGGDPIEGRARARARRHSRARANYCMRWWLVSLGSLAARGRACTARRARAGERERQPQLLFGVCVLWFAFFLPASQRAAARARARHAARVTPAEELLPASNPRAGDSIGRCAVDGARESPPKKAALRAPGRRACPGGPH